MLAGLIILVFGAEILVRGSVGTALRLGLTPLLIGLTVVAFGTSSPELVVSIGAALTGKSDIALGNIVGSNIGNIALILGLSALIQPMKVQANILKKDVPILLGVSVILILFLLDGEISQIEGGLFFIGIILFTVFSIRMSRIETSKAVKDEFEDIVPRKTYPAWVEIGMIVIGLGALMLGAKWLVDGAVEMANNFGISEAVIGLTIVAIGTSLPELATSMVAAYKKEGDIAIGNVIGSNIFNVLSILGITAMILPIQQGGITDIDLYLNLFLTVLLMPILRTGFVISRIEGLFLVLGYVFYTLYLVYFTTV
jgi:cation:H+ antiporter